MRFHFIRMDVMNGLRVWRVVRRLFPECWREVGE
jgi:hypothetical protein